MCWWFSPNQVAIIGTNEDSPDSTLQLGMSFYFIKFTLLSQNVSHAKWIPSFKCHSQEIACWHIGWVSDYLELPVTEMFNVIKQLGAAIGGFGCHPCFLSRRGVCALLSAATQNKCDTALTLQETIDKQRWTFWVINQSPGWDLFLLLSDQTGARWVPCCYGPWGTGCICLSMSIPDSQLKAARFNGSWWMIVMLAEPLRAMGHCGKLTT